MTEWIFTVHENSIDGDLNGVIEEGQTMICRRMRKRAPEIIHDSDVARAFRFAHRPRFFNKQDIFTTQLNLPDSDGRPHLHDLVIARFTAVPDGKAMPKGHKHWYEGEIEPADHLLDIMRDYGVDSSLLSDFEGLTHYGTWHGSGL